MTGPAGANAARDERDLLADQLAHPPFGRDRADVKEARLRVSAYRLDDGVVINGWTGADLAAHARRGAGCLARLGIDRVRALSHLLPGALEPLGALALADVLDLGPTLDVPVGPLESDMVVTRARDVWDLVHPPVILGPPRELVVLADKVGRELATRFGVELLVSLDEGPLDRDRRRAIVEQTGLAVAEILGVRALYPFLGTRPGPDEPFTIDAAGVDVAIDPSGSVVVTALDLSGAPLAVRTRLRGRLAGRSGDVLQLFLEEDR
jgi:hypothetical protein